MAAAIGRHSTSVLALTLTLSPAPSWRADFVRAPAFLFCGASDPPRRPRTSRCSGGESAAAAQTTATAPFLAIEEGKEPGAASSAARGRGSEAMMSWLRSDRALVARASSRGRARSFGAATSECGASRVPADASDPAPRGGAVQTASGEEESCVASGDGGESAAPSPGQASAADAASEARQRFFAAGRKHESQRPQRLLAIYAGLVPPSPSPPSLLKPWLAQRLKCFEPTPVRKSTRKQVEVASICQKCNLGSPSNPPKPPLHRGVGFRTAMASPPPPPPQVRLARATSICQWNGFPLEPPPHRRVGSGSRDKRRAWKIRRGQAPRAQMG